MSGPQALLGFSSALYNQLAMPSEPPRISLNAFLTIPYILKVKGLPGVQVSSLVQSAVASRQDHVIHCLLFRSYGQSLLQIDETRRCQHSTG